MVIDECDGNFLYPILTPSKCEGDCSLSFKGFEMIFIITHIYVDNLKKANLFI